MVHELQQATDEFIPSCQGLPECFTVQPTRRNKQPSNEDACRECCGERRVVPAHRALPRPHRHESVAAARRLLDWWCWSCGETGSCSGSRCGARDRGCGDWLLSHSRIRCVARGVVYRIRHQRVDEDTAEAHLVGVVLKPVERFEQAEDAAARTEEWGVYGGASLDASTRAHHSRR